LGFYSRNRKQAPKGQEDRAPTGQRRVSADDLDIEKKWLQLVRIDQEQFALFFDKYHDRIFRYVFLRLGDHDLAGELTGEVFIIAWKHIGRFTWQGYSFGAWLFQIARRVVSHEIRRRGMRRETEFKPEVHDFGAEEGQDAGSLDRDDRELIRRCVAKLPPERQDVIVLHYWMGMTLDQVALVMKTPRGTVSSHLRRARRSLMDLLQEAGLSGAAVRGMHRHEARDFGIEVVGRRKKDLADGD